MSFGIAPIELMAGAENAIDVCLDVQPGEHVALIADEISRSVAASLEKAVKERGAEFTGLLLEDFGPRPMKGAPAPVLEALETADVGVLCMTPQPGELSARMSIVKVVERRQIRYAHMVGVTPEIMQEGMRADYHLVDRLSDKLRERMLRAETLTVKTEAGTSFSAHFDRHLDWVKTSGLISPRYWSNLPAGEVFTTPGTVDGRFVCDATAGDYFNGKYGDLQETPMGAEKPRIPKMTWAAPPQGDTGAVAETARLLVNAENPVIIADRCARTPAGLQYLIELANVLQCAVINQYGRMNFPSRHPLNQTERAGAVIRGADVILGLEVWV